MAIFARTANGDWAVPLAVVTDVGTIAAQKCNDCLNLWQAAWVFNRLEGFPWLQKVLGKKANAVTLALFRSLMRNALLQVPSVVSVTELFVTVSGPKRQLSYAFRAPLNNGQVLVGGSGQPFIVTGNASA